jgi:hypothetical protein
VARRYRGVRVDDFRVSRGDPQVLLKENGIAFNMLV